MGLGLWSRFPFWALFLGTFCGKLTRVFGGTSNGVQVIVVSKVVIDLIGFVLFQVIESRVVRWGVWVRG